MHSRNRLVISGTTAIPHPTSVRAPQRPTGAVTGHCAQPYHSFVADDDPEEPFSDQPFSNIPFLGDIAAMLGNEASLWEGARQAATQLATGGKPEHNVDPAIRHRLSEISRVAELHVAHVTHLDIVPARTEPVTRSGWATAALDAIRPLMDRLSERLANETTNDPFAGLLRMMSPMTVAMTAGMMAGHLATKAFGNSDLGVPMGRVLIVPSNVIDFASEWSLDVDDVMLWVAIREHAMHSMLAVPHIRTELDGLLLRYIEGFQRSDRGFEEMLDLDMSNDPSQLTTQLQRIFGNPELLLGVSRDDSQNDKSQLEALLSVVHAYIDDVVAQAGSRLIGSFDALSEAVRRRRLMGTDYADRLLGVRLSAEARDRGGAFIVGVIERAGRDGLARLFEPDSLPTPHEVAAPGLWLARLDLPTD